MSEQICQECGCQDKAFTKNHLDRCSHASKCESCGVRLDQDKPALHREFLFEQNSSILSRFMTMPMVPRQRSFSLSSAKKKEE